MEKKNYLKYWKEIVIVILLIFLFIGYNKLSNTTTSLADIENALKISRQETKLFKDKSGKLVAEKQVMQLNINDLTQNGNQLGLDMTDIKSQVGNLKNLVNRMEGKINTQGSVEAGIDELKGDLLAALAKGDTSKENISKLKERYKPFKWSSDYLLVTDGLIDLKENKVNFNYTYSTKFTNTTFWKKEDGFKNKFKPKSLVVQLKFEDQNAFADSVQNINVKPPPKKFYEKTLFKVAVGFTSGLYLSSRFLN